MSIKIMAVIDSYSKLSSDKDKLFNLCENEKRMRCVLAGNNRYILTDYESLNANPDKYSFYNIFIFDESGKLEKYLDVVSYTSVDDVLARFLDSGDSLWIVGSSSKIYDKFIEYATLMDITEVQERSNIPSSFFPWFNLDDFDIDRKECVEDNIIYHNVVYKRKVRKR